MKKRVVSVLIALLVLAALAAGSRFLQAEEPAADVTMTGVVVDMHCYVTRGAADAEHAGCANACIARGVPAGFLAEDGTLYVLLAEKPVSVKDQVKDLAAVPAKLIGTPVTRGGVRGIRMKSIEKAGS
jgi:hypothetical protein